MVSCCLTRSHLDSLGFTRTHLVSLGFTWSHQVSHGLTWFHVDSPGLIWFHWVSLGLTWPRLVSLGLNWTHMIPTGKREKPECLKGKGKPPLGHFEPVPTLHPERAHARTNRNRNRFPGWTHPPTSDLSSQVQKFRCRSSARMMARASR